MTATTYRRRWGDNDVNLGPLTFAAPGGYKSTALMLSSGDDEGSCAGFRVSISGWTAILALPRWLVPTERKKVYPGAAWDAATVARLGRDWYWDETRREYGVSLHGGLLSIHYGRQTHDSSTEQRWSKFLPWTQWRHVRHSLYGLDGALFAHLPQHRLWNSPERAEGQRLKEACPTATFAFKDFDGEALTVVTKIEEREWRLGEGWFKWLSALTKPKVRRSLDLRFTGETGRRKGSWKGGTLGHGIDMLPGELHEAAFARYCAGHEMQFVGSA